MGRIVSEDKLAAILRHPLIASLQDSLQKRRAVEAPVEVIQSRSS